MARPMAGSSGWLIVRGIVLIVLATLTSVNAQTQTPRTLTVALKELPLSFDYGYDWSEAGVWVQSNIGDCLIWRDRATADYVPWLAESWEQVDDLTWRITLRPNVAFTNGEAFDATAAKFWFDRIRADPKMLPHRQWDFIDHVDVIDPLNIRIQTVAPEPAFLNKMAGTGCQVVPPAYISEVGSEGSAERQSAPVRSSSSSGFRMSGWYSRQTRTISAARPGSTGWYSWQSRKMRLVRLPCYGSGRPHPVTPPTRLATHRGCWQQ